MSERVCIVAIGSSAGRRAEVRANQPGERYAQAIATHPGVAGDPVRSGDNDKRGGRPRRVHSRSLRMRAKTGKAAAAPGREAKPGGWSGMVGNRGAAAGGGGGSRDVE